ncbi:hypothetical protein [Salinispora oceanensis]|uniref:hypothetical protein n=1 Tax=Salinispora oceanensis TaxID=1050199 RepID=UPI0037C5AE44
MVSADLICVREAGEPSWRGGQLVGSDFGGGGGACVSGTDFVASGDDVVAVGFDAGRTLGDLLGAALRLGASPSSVRANGVDVVAVGDAAGVLVSPVGPVGPAALGASSPAHPTVSSATANALMPIRSTLMPPPPTDAR